VNAAPVGDRSWVMVHFRCINLAKQWVVIGHFTQNQGIMSDGVFTCMTPHANQWVVIKRAHYQKLSSELKACSQMDVWMDIDGCGSECKKSSLPKA